MGDRLHIAKKYDVQYGNVVGFNNRIEEFQYLLDFLEIEPAGEVVVGNVFEIDKEEWKDGIEKLREIEDEAELSGFLSEIYMTKDKLISLMESFLKEADPDNDYLAFNFF